MSSHKNKTHHDKTYRDNHIEELKLYFKNHYQTNKEKKLSYQKEYYQLNKERVSQRNRIRHLKLNYNLTSQQYLEKLITQNNCCAICNKPEHRLLKTGDIKPLSVDHNHITGEVRDLLYNDCNSLLGFAKENVEILQNAINYLNRNW